MTFLLPVSVDGSLSVQARGEYTSDYVANAFNTQLQTFVDLFNIGTSIDPPPTADQIKQAVLDGGYGDNGSTAGAINEALTNLIFMAQWGVTPEGEPFDPFLINTNSPRDYLNTEMISSLNEIIKTVKAAGGVVDLSGGYPDVHFSDDAAVNWKNLAVSSQAILQIMATAQAQVSQNRTLQALTELIYVRTGNDLLTQNLAELESALSTTSDSLRTLSQLQDFLNRVQPAEQTQSFTEFASANYNANATEFLMGVTGSGSFPGIVNQASDYFQQIALTVTIAEFSDSDLAQFLDLRTQLTQQISLLTSLTPNAGAGDDAGTLLDSLRKVKDSMDAAIDAAHDPRYPSSGISESERVKFAMRLWILDNRNSGSIDQIGDASSGQTQRSLTSAISAGQSLNDTQKQEVRRYLFVFEEYYKSASAILTKITQLIERMAQGIAR